MERRPNRIAKKRLMAVALGLIGVAASAQTPRFPEDKVYDEKPEPVHARGVERNLITLYSHYHKEGFSVAPAEWPGEKQLARLLRCRGFGEERAVDENLVRAALAAARHFEVQRLEVISGYRSEKFNDSLLKKGRSAVPGSRHTRGQALDFSLVSVPPAQVGVATLPRRGRDLRGRQFCPYRYRPQAALEGALSHRWKTPRLSLT